MSEAVYSHTFGGDWTTDKLQRLRKYLDAYVHAMKNTRFQLIYIDAFAGTGYRSPRRHDSQPELAFSEFAGTKGFLDGSARIALQIEPRFSRYIFIEKSEKRHRELLKLKAASQLLASRIDPVNEEANHYILRICKEPWGDRRAVLFLDPYGMQIEWETIKAIAKTQAIDLWILFPLGIGVMRLLRRDGQITPARRRRLDLLFGDTEWYDVFYSRKEKDELFGTRESTEKVGDFKAIGDYFNARLMTVFSGVAPKPLTLRNSRNNPLYLFCFAAGNPKGSTIAVRIADHILRH